MLCCTKDYSIFKIHPQNRERDELHLNKVIASMRIKNLTRVEPVLVDKDLQIINGQYRFWACVALGLELWYQVDDKIEVSDMLLLSRAQKPWKSVDFIHYYNLEGRQGYVNFHRTAQENGISYRDLLIFCEIGGHHWNAIKSGTFKFDYEKKSHKIKQLLLTFRNLKEIVKTRATGRTNYVDAMNFIKALVALSSKRNYCHDKIILKIIKGIGKMGSRTSVDQYYEMLQEIYNCHNNRPIKEKRGERFIGKSNNDD